VSARFCPPAISKPYQPASVIARTVSTHTYCTVHTTGRRLESEKLVDCLPSSRSILLPYFVTLFVPAEVCTMTALPLRIAILECDTPLDGTRSKYGGYGGVFTALLRAGADALSHPGLSSTAGLELTTWDVVTAQEYPSLDSIDAILMSGSRHNSFENDPWILKLVDFVKGVLNQKRVRIIGVCFGHQIVGRAMGVKVDRSDKGWEISVTAIDLTKRGQEIFGRPSLVCTIERSLGILS
jgi:hypothetical protein